MGATSTNDAGAVSADAVGTRTGAGSVTSPPFVHLYTVLMEADVSIAVVVYPATVKVVVYVTTTVVRSVLALGAALGYCAAPRSPEGLAHSLMEVMRTVGALGIGGSEDPTVFWPDGDAATPLTVRTAGVGSFSALATKSGPGGMAVTVALVRGTVAVS